MDTVMQRENERGRLTVQGYYTDDGGWCSLVAVHEVGGRWTLDPHGASQLGAPEEGRGGPGGYGDHGPVSDEDRAAEHLRRAAERGSAAAREVGLAALRASARCGQMLAPMHLTELEETVLQRHHWRVPTVLCGAENLPAPCDSRTDDCPGCQDCLRYCPACVDVAARWCAQTD